MVINLVGASSGRPNIIEVNGERRPVMTSGYNEAKGAKGEIWVVSSVFKKLEFQDDVTLIFSLHQNPGAHEAWEAEESRRLLTPWVFPWKRMADRYGPVFGSSLAWMICMAIERRATEINLFGFDLATNTEYAEQRDTAFYWIGRAEALGIAVNIPEMSRMFFKDRIYGVLL